MLLSQRQQPQCACRLRNDPNEPKALSGLSPYIHFGQLGMQRAALRCVEVKSKFRVRACPHLAACPGTAGLCWRAVLAVPAWLAHAQVSASSSCCCWWTHLSALHSSWRGT